MDRLFDSLLTAFFVGVDGSIHVLLIPNSRLSRKVAKNPFFNVKNGCMCLILRSRSRINSCNSHRPLHVLATCPTYPLSIRPSTSQDQLEVDSTTTPCRAAWEGESCWSREGKSLGNRF